jgi:hypothetical protein
MKRKNLKHSLIIVALLGTFMFTLTQMANAKKIPPKSCPVVTLCCSEGQVTGYSADCDEGNCTCFNYQCAQGEIETNGPMCPN